MYLFQRAFYVKDSFYKYEILDSNGNEYFKVKHQRMNNSITLYDLNSKPLATLATIKNSFNCQKIFSEIENESNKEMECFKFRNTSNQLHKLNVEFLNSLEVSFLKLIVKVVGTFDI